MIYNSALLDEAAGDIDYDSDTFYVMLVDETYVANKKIHKDRSDVVGEIVGDGYTAGGMAVDVTISESDTNDTVDIELGGALWPVSTITAYGAVYYKRRGGVASDDELVYFNDFGGAVSSTNGSFTLESSIIRKQN